MTHKISVGVHDKRLGRGEQTIPLVGPGNLSKDMQKFLNPVQGKGPQKRAKKIPAAVLQRAIRNELTRRRNQSRRKG